MRVQKLNKSKKLALIPFLLLITISLAALLCLNACNADNELKAAGNPIPTNDIWIAALALQHGIKLLTMDNHFKKVPGLFLI